MIGTATRHNFPDRLLRIWAARYLPNFTHETHATDRLIAVAGLPGRLSTVNQVRRSLHFYCELAALRTQTLFADAPNLVNLNEVKRLAQYIKQVYEAILELYQQVQPPIAHLHNQQLYWTEEFLSTIEPLEVHQLSAQLAPVLAELQAAHLNSRDPRAIGSVTTQFHFSSEEILRRLTPAEQALIRPYFRFAEEQVCIPWQQICTVAATYPVNAPTVLAVESLLSSSQATAEAVYNQAMQFYPKAGSRRGGLSQAGIRASVIRDLTMFQGYLGLCALEKSMVPLEQRLLPLCLLVFPAVEVTWELVEHMLQLLVDEIQVNVPIDQVQLLRPYMQKLQELFQIR